MTRAEHLQWAKDRALELARGGDNGQALASMISDLGKHPETSSSVDIAATLGMNLMIAGYLSTESEMVNWINGFN